MIPNPIFVPAAIVPPVENTNLVITQTDTASDTTDKSSWSFTGLSVGAAPDTGAGQERWIMLAIGIWDDAAASAGITSNSVTINGSTVLTREETASDTPNTGIWLGTHKVNSGTTIDVAFSATNTQSAVYVAVYSVITEDSQNYTFNADSDSVISFDQGSQTLTLPAAKKGSAYIGVAAAEAGNGGTFTWTDEFGNAFGTSETETLVEGAQGYISIVSGVYPWNLPGMDITVANSNGSAAFTAGVMMLDRG